MANDGGQHWLDLVCYAEANSYKVDAVKPSNAFRSITVAFRIESTECMLSLIHI